MSSDKGYNGKKKFKNRYENNDRSPSRRKRSSDLNLTANKNYYAPKGFDESDSKSIIIGRNPVIESLKSGKLIDSIYVNSEAGGSISVICRMAREQGIVIKQVNEQKLNKMANGASHQGVIAMLKLRIFLKLQRKRTSLRLLLSVTR